MIGGISRALADLKQELMIQQSVHKEEQTPFPDNGTSGLAKFEAAYKARKEAQAAAAAGVAGANAVPCTPARSGSGATDSNRIATENGGSSSSKRALRSPRISLALLDSSCELDRFLGLARLVSCDIWCGPGKLSMETA